MSRPELTAVVLCYRAGTELLRVIEPLHKQLSASGHESEMVLVANFWQGVDDPTPEIARAFAASYPNVVVISEPKQGGMGWDFRAGLRAATGERIVVIDGDAQNPTDDVLRMFRLMVETGSPVMKGLRIARYDGIYRRFVSTFYNLLFRAVFGTTGLWDINGKPKGLTREAYEAMSLESSDWFIDAEIVLEAKRLDLHVGEMPVVFRRNDQRPSFVKPSAILEFLRNMTARRVRPHR